MNLFKRFGADIVRVALAAVLLSALTPAAAQVWKWSQTSATNGSVDPHINFSEGQAPSSLNDSARALMAEVAKYRDDISGALTTSGTASAYTITSNQDLSSGGTVSTPQTGQLIAFKPHVTNNDSATLRIDGGTVYPIQQQSGVGIGPGTLISGTPYSATFNGTAWILREFYGNPYAVPLGAYLDSSTDTPPNSNFVLPAGQCISRTTYAAYFALVGTRYGACDGTTTFGVPDFRGRAAYAVDNLNGSAANRMTSGGGCGVTFTTPGAACSPTQSATLSTSNLPPYVPTGTIGISDPGHAHTVPGGYIRSDGGQSGANIGSGSSYFINTNPTTFGSFTGISAVFYGTAQGGTSTPFGIVGNAYAVAKFLRVL